MVPVCVMFEHGVEYGEELAHAGGNGNLGSFPCGAEPLIEGFDGGVMPSGHESSHIQTCSYVASPAPSGTVPSESAAITVEWCYTYQSGYPSTVQGT